MRLTEITLQANSLTSLQRFYKEVMDLPVLFSDENRLEIRTGKSILNFEKNADKKDSFYYVAFNIPFNKFEEACAWLKPKISFLWLNDFKSYMADCRNWNAQSVYFYDPAGNILELIARFELENSIARAFSGSYISTMSELEIEFSAHNFHLEGTGFMEKYNLHFFEKQLAVSNFKVSGDDNGLFIMEPQDREWFPGTGKNSDFFPVRGSFETEYGQFEWPCIN